MSNIKLNLGSGLDKRNGWLNVDIDAATDPDIVFDLQTKLPIVDNVVDRVLLQDVLEHLTKEQAMFLVDELYRITKPGALIEIRLPNIDQIVSQFNHDPQVMFEFIYGTTTENGVWGAHKFGYNPQTLAKMLAERGFLVAKTKQETTNYWFEAKRVGKLTELNLLVIQQSPDWGGAEEWMCLVVEGLIKNYGSQVRVVTNLQAIRDRLRFVGAKVENLPVVLDVIGNIKGLIKSALLFPVAIWFYLNLLTKAKKNKTNLILMSGFSEKLLVTWLARIFSLPIVWYEYGPLAQVLNKNLLLPKLLYRITKDLPERIITLSKNTKNSLIADAHVSLAKLKVVPPGIKLPDKKMTTDNLTVGCLSRLAEEKGQLRLLQAWKIVIEKLPHARLIIAGKGPYEAELKRFVQQNNLQKSVEFVGFVDDKENFYKKLRLFVFPSSWELEGFGLVVIESLSFGVPVIIFDHPPANEVVSSRVGGLVIAASPQGLADRITELLTSDKYQDLSKSARKLVDSRYNYDVQINKLYSELVQVVNYQRYKHEIKYSNSD